MRGRRTTWATVVAIGLTTGCATSYVTVNGAELRAHADEFRRAGAAVVKVSPHGTRMLRADRKLVLEVETGRHLGRTTLRLSIAELIDGCSITSPAFEIATTPPQAMPPSENKVCLLDHADYQNFTLETSTHLEWNVVGVGAVAALTTGLGGCLAKCEDGGVPKTVSEIALVAAGVALVYLIATADWKGLGAFN